MKYDYVDQDWGWERGQEDGFRYERVRGGQFLIITPKLRHLPK